MPCMSIVHSIVDEILLLRTLKMYAKSYDVVLYILEIPKEVELKP